MTKKESFRCPNIFMGSDKKTKWCQAKAGIGITDQRCTREYPGCPFIKSGNLVDNTPKRSGVLAAVMNRLKR